MLIGGSGWGTVFCRFLRLLHVSLAMDNDCSGSDGAGKLFRGIKNFSSFCFLVAIKFFLVILSVNANANMLQLQMKSREENKGCNRPIRPGVRKHYDWFILVKKYFRVSTEFQKHNSMIFP